MGEKVTDYASDFKYTGILPYLSHIIRNISVCFLIFLVFLAVANFRILLKRASTAVLLYTSLLLILNVIMPFLAIDISRNISSSVLSLCELPSTSMATFILGMKISTKYILFPHRIYFCTSILKCVSFLIISSIFNSGIVLFSINSCLLFNIHSFLFISCILLNLLLILYFKTSGNGGSERQETLIGKVQKFCFLPMPTGFSLNIGLKEPPYEERKRYYRNSSSVSQVSAVQAQTSASCCRTPSDCSDRILRHCGRFKNSSNRVPVHKTVMGIKIPCKSLKDGDRLHAGYILTLSKVLYRYPSISPSSIPVSKTIAAQKYNEFPKHARNVNFVLTFGIACSEWCCRKIAAIRKSLCHNALRVNILWLDGCKFVVLNVVGSSPTGHPTIKPIDYQIVNGYFCTKNLPNPP